MSRFLDFQDWLTARSYAHAFKTLRVSGITNGYEIRTIRWDARVGMNAAYHTRLHAPCPEQSWFGWRKQMAEVLREHRHQLTAILATGKTTDPLWMEKT